MPHYDRYVNPGGEQNDFTKSPPEATDESVLEEAADALRQADVEAGQGDVTRRVIQQSVVLPATAETLFGMYLDPVAHSAFTGFPVTIGAEPGAEFRAFDGQLSGRVLVVVRPRLIVQSWRSTKFRADDPDSTLILTFTGEAAGAPGGRIDLVHLDVPEHDFQGVTEGWPKFYWEPWRAYLERRLKN